MAKAHLKKTARPARAKTGAKATTPSAAKAAPAAPPPAAPAPGAASTASAVTAAASTDTAFWWRAAAILLLAAVLRLLWLGRATFHPDEAIHAVEAYNFLDYRFDPVYHGPLLYHLEALALRVFGDTDFTARLVPAFLGIGLVALVLGSARRWVGNAAALWSAALLALSPVNVAYSRRLLHDALVLVLTLGAVLYFQAARENGTRTWEGREARVGVVLMLVLFLATKANAFFIIAMLLGYWLCIWLRPKTLPASRVNHRLRWMLPLCLYGLVAVGAFLAVRGGETQKRNEMLLLGLCLGCCAVLWLWLRLTHRGPEEAAGQWDVWTPLLAAGIGGLVFAFLYGRGFLWLHNGISAESRRDALSALPRMLAYWRGQQGTPRLPGPHDYYIVLAMLYELPIVIAGACGIFHASRVRTAFSDLLLWWCFTSFAVYALANEKVPWLLTHQILPLALLAGLWLASLRPSRRLYLGVAASVVFLARNLAATSFGRPGDNHEPLYYAQPTDAFGETFQAAMAEAIWSKPQGAGGIWLEAAPNAFSAQWPCAWYVRRAAERAGARTAYGARPDDFAGPASQRLAVMRPEVWAQLKSTKFPGWRTWNGAKQPPGAESNLDFLVWPRASWSALNPPTFYRWWLTREANQGNNVLSEWSSTAMVVATRQ